MGFFIRYHSNFILLQISSWERGLKLPNRGGELGKKVVHLHRSMLGAPIFGLIPRPWDFSSGIIVTLLFSKSVFEREVLSSQIEEEN